MQLPLHKRQFYLGNLLLKKNNVIGDKDVGYESIYTDVIEEGPGKVNVLFEPVATDPNHSEYKDHIAYNIYVTTGFEIPIHAESTVISKIDPSPPAKSRW